VSRTQSPLTTRGLELIRAGHTLRSVAELLGIDKSTLVRACQRHGIAMARGRPPARQAAAES